MAITGPSWQVHENSSERTRSNGVRQCPFWVILVACLLIVSRCSRFFSPGGVARETVLARQEAI